MYLPISEYEKSSTPRATLNDLRNFLAGRAVGITRDEGLLEEVIKILFCLRNLDIAQLQRDEFERAKIVRSKFIDIKKKYPDFYEPTDEILLDPHSLGYVIDKLKRLTQSEKSGFDIVGDCYEIFIGNQIRGQEGQFFTPEVAVNYLVEAVDPRPSWKIIDTACGASGFLSALFIFFSQKYGFVKAKEFVRNNLYGIEKDKYLARLGKIHLSLMSGEGPKVVVGDSLSMKGDSEIDKIHEDSFDLVITNPPFGSKIKSADRETMKKYDLGHKWEQSGENFVKSDFLNENTPPQVLFMERNIRALKQGGILASVVPESLLSNKNYKHVVQYLFNEGQLISIVGMPESLFKTSGKGGTHTKTSLLIFKRRSKKNTDRIFFAEAKWCGHDSRGNPIPRNDLPEILENYSAFQKGKLKTNASLGYSLMYSDIDDHILAPKFYDIDLKNVLKTMNTNYLLVKISDLVKNNALDIRTGNEVGKLAYGSGNIPFVRTSDFSNWEILLEPKQLVGEDIYNLIRDKQDVRAGDILMVKDGTYLIGITAFVTDLDTKMVYQSHIYKIRVLANKYGLNSYNFLGLLSSDFVQRQIKSKQLTQDIIDSLGKRIYDLVIPIPKNSDKLNKLTAKVKKVIDLRRESRYEHKKAVDYINSQPL